MMYTEKVLDHFTSPRNVGELENANAIGEVGNAKCGDIMKIYLKIEDNKIEDVSFKTFGCGAAIATSSIATELIKGKSIEDALKLTNSAVMESLDGLPPAKVHCSILAEQAVKKAVSDFYERQGIDPTPIVGTITECDGHDH
ncbi:MAG: Fe-S cluster assembly scaffold protein NifU [Oscillospiraceae bacterium]